MSGGVGGCHWNGGGLPIRILDLDMWDDGVLIRSEHRHVDPRERNWKVIWYRAC